MKSLTRSYQQCTRCVMDTSDPDIRFDGAGYCNHCTAMLTLRTQTAARQGEVAREWENWLRKIRTAGKGRRYDCVVGVSGGVDSSYVAYLAKDYGMRPLLVHMDNGWNTEQAVLNIHNLAERLGFDYECSVLDWEEFRDLQLAFLRASVVEAETPTDMAIPGVLHRTAARHGIKYIVTGGNIATEGILPAYWHYNAKDLRYVQAIQARFGTKKLRRFPTFGYTIETYYKLAHRIGIVHILDYVPFSKEAAIDILTKKLEWTAYGGKHHENLYTRFVQSYLLPVKFGIDYRRATYSSQICDGTLSREEALTLLERPPYDATRIEADLDYVAKKLRVSRAELDRIIASPPKSHRDYPNDERRLNFIYRIYRRFFK